MIVGLAPESSVATNAGSRWKKAARGEIDWSFLAIRRNFPGPFVE